jgi:lysylphosphatidylglycerol synthetase-like protein (DUF2156 family)
MLTPDMRQITLWAAIVLYAASVVTCVVTFVWALKKRVPWQGPASVAYLHPLTYVFLGTGFIVYALGTNVLWPRGLLFASGLLQFLVFAVMRSRARKSQPVSEPRKMDS